MSFRPKQNELDKMIRMLMLIVGNSLVDKIEDKIREVDAVATGYLRKSFRLRWEGDTLLVYSEAPYSAVVEFGCRPHTPPYDQILRWVNIKKGEYGEEAKKAAWRIIAKIRKHGYEGRFYAGKALQEMVSGK